jgi:hypothetical protein
MRYEVQAFDGASRATCTEGSSYPESLAQFGARDVVNVRHCESSNHRTRGRKINLLGCADL